jgi:RimJ/RimL family protein N-acetyltransferase
LLGDFLLEFHFLFDDAVGGGKMVLPLFIDQGSDFASNPYKSPIFLVETEIPGRKIRRLEMRLAKREDLPAVYSLFLMVKKRMEEEGNRTWSHAYPTRGIFREDILDQHLYIHKEAGKIIASISIAFSPLDDFFFQSQSKKKHAQLRQDTGMKENERFLLLHRLMISPAYQGHHLSGEVFSEMEVLYPHSLLVFAVYPDNKHAMAAYEKEGFSHTGIYPFEWGNKRKMLPLFPPWQIRAQLTESKPVSPRIFECDER